MAHIHIIDTHAHIADREFDPDRDEAVARAKDAGVGGILVPSVDLPSAVAALEVCGRHPGYAFPMIGLHPGEVKDGWESVLDTMEGILESDAGGRFVAIGETGLDYYWDRGREKEQLAAFERQVEWSAGSGLPLVIHCRKAQNEMVRLLRRYAGRLPGGVFHCFTGNEKEAAELLSFPGFMLGIGGALTFRNSRLPEVLRSVPLGRIVLETDSPFMAPVPVRGRRNESSFLRYVLAKVAECYGVPAAQAADATSANAARVFTRCFGQSAG